MTSCTKWNVLFILVCIHYNKESTIVNHFKARTHFYLNLDSHLWVSQLHVHSCQISTCLSGTLDFASSLLLDVFEYGYTYG